MERESLFEEAAVARETREGDRERGGRRTFFVGGGLGAWATENSLFFFLFLSSSATPSSLGETCELQKGKEKRAGRRKKARKGERKFRPRSVCSPALFLSSVLTSSSNSSSRAAAEASSTFPCSLIYSLARSLAYLLDGDLALHAGALVRLAVVGVLSGGGQLDRVRLPGRVEVVLVRERLGVHARRHGVLVKDDVVREAGVVAEGQRVPGLDGDRGRVEDERARVGAEVDGGVGVGGEGEREPGDAGSGALEEAVIYFIFLEVERGGGGS